MTIQNEMTIHNAADLVAARLNVREWARCSGLSLTDQAVISMAVYTLANALGFGMGLDSSGKIMISNCQQGARHGMSVTCHKKGKSIVIPNTNQHTRLVDEVDMKVARPDEVSIVLTMWAKH